MRWFSPVFDNGDEILLATDQPFGQLDTGQAIEVGANIHDQCEMGLETQKGQNLLITNSGLSQRRYSVFLTTDYWLLTTVLSHAAASCTTCP